MTDTGTGRPAPAEEPVFFATFADIAEDPDLWPRPAPVDHGSLEVLETLRLDPPARGVKPARRRPVPKPAVRVTRDVARSAAGHRCAHCAGKLPLRARKGTRFCGTRCRVASHRAGVPHELRSRPRWVTHSAKKVPLTPRGRPASSTDRETWSRYEDVADMERRGFVLNGDGIVCLDLDHCLVDGQVVGRAAEVLARCPRTYVEVSLSGTGLHVWGRADVSAGRRLSGGVEVYGSGRFIAVTGERFGRCPSTLADVSEVVAWLLEA